MLRDTNHITDAHMCKDIIGAVNHRVDGTEWSVFILTFLFYVQQNDLLDKLVCIPLLHISVALLKSG
jgi:hypothetical protein